MELLIYWLEFLGNCKLWPYVIDLIHDFEQMTLAQYKKEWTCSDWTDIKSLSFCYYDLDLDLWTLVLKSDPDIVMTYFHTKMSSIGSNSIS